MSSLTRAAIPWRAYLEPPVLERELRVLRTAWHYVGAASRLDAPGTMFPARVLDVEVILTRDAHGEVHCLRNACRHRGARLVDAPCARRSITCPYHAWSYGLDGSLRGAPRVELGAIDAGSLDLPRVRLERWGGLLFACLDDDAPSLEQSLAGVPERVAALGVDVDALTWHSTHASTTRCNWKVAVENYLECYHCRVAHPGLVGALDVRPESYRLEVDGRRISQSGARRTGAALDTAGPIERGEYHYVFPNLVVNVAPGRPNLSLGPIVPRGVGATWRSLDYLFARAEEPAWIEQLIAWDDQVGREDVALVERVQQGMAAAVALEVAGGMPAAGVLLERDEQLVRAFHDLWNDAVTG